MMMMTTLMEKTIQSHSSSTARTSSTSSAKPNLFSPVPNNNNTAAVSHSPSSHTSSPSPAPSSPASTPTPSLAPITPPSVSCAPMTTDHDLDLDHDRSNTQAPGSTFDDARTTTEHAMAPLPSAQTQPRLFVANSSSNVHNTEKLSEAIGSHPIVKPESNISASKTQTQTQLSLTACASLGSQTQQQPQRQVAQIKAQPQLIAHPNSPCSSSKAQSGTNSSSPIQASTALLAPGGSAKAGVSSTHQQVSQQQQQQQLQQQQQPHASSSSVLKTGTFTFTTPGEGGLHGPIQDLHIPPTSQQSGSSGSSSSSSLVTAARPSEDVVMTGSSILTATNSNNNITNTLPPTPTPTPNATPGSTPRKSRSKGGRRAANPHLTEEQRRRERVLKNRESAMKSLQKKKRYTQNLEHHAIALAKRNAELRDKIGVLLVRLNHLHGLPAQQLGLETLNLGTSSGPSGGISTPAVPHLGGTATPSSAPMTDHTLAFANNSNNTNRMGGNAHAGDIGMYNKDPTNRMRIAQPLEGDGAAGWRSLSFEQGGISSAAQYINNPNLHTHATLPLSQQQQQQASAASSLLFDNNNNNNNSNNMKSMHQPPQQSALISSSSSSQSLPNVVAPSDCCPTVLDSPI